MSKPEFVALIPARRSSNRLPDKPLLDIGGVPMVVRTARQALKSGARAVWVATDDAEIAAVCQRHDIGHVMTDKSHPSGSDRLAQACQRLGLADDQVVLNVQGDEPLIAPDLIRQVAHTLTRRADCVMATAAHPIDEASEFMSPHAVKVVLDAQGTAMYFSRAPIPWWRDGYAQGVQTLAQPAPLRHLGIYAYRCHFLKQFPLLAMAPSESCESLEQLRVLWHGHKIAVHIDHSPPSPGVDTPEDLAQVRRIVATHDTSATQKGLRDIL